MVTQEDIEQIERWVNNHLSQLLLVAETALPVSQFLAYRKFALNEFGKNGLGKDLRRIYDEKHYKER
jgi:hypothetical protein